ncbi:exodeoxyribonuclease III [Candidatus Saccharibacteria bacterium]|nr:exodeoxyribonuclease III [Candidatus Saccharibacteria bacterium]
MRELKLFSWNVNGLRAVLKKGALVDFLEREYPDVLCLQEIKCTPAQVDLEKENEIFRDYEIFWNPAKRLGYSGVAVLIKKVILKHSADSSSQNYNSHKNECLDSTSAEFLTGCCNYDDCELRTLKNNFLELTRNEGRIKIINLDNFYLVNVYTPNSKPDLSRLSLREKTWDPEFLELLKTLEKEKPVVTCGDFNCANEEIDLARPKTNHKNAGFTDEERRGLSNLLAAGFLDTFRFKFPEEKRYTWWSHWGNARKNNVGWRIDYFFISKSLEKNLASAEIYESYFGSDHCPISITLTFPETSEA